MRTKYPEAAKLFWVGYSLGAANTLKYLSSELYNKAIENCTERYKDDEDRGTRYYEDHRDHRKCVIDAAVCVSPPWNLVNNNTPVFSLWSRLLVLPLKVYSLTHHRMLRGFQEMYPELSIFTLLTARDITHFDSLFYRTYGNYNSVQEYYEKASPIHSVNQIHCHTPTLAISAKDDPICGHVDCPTDPDQLGSGIIVVKTPFGGHLAFPEGIVALTDAWTDRVAIQWFNHFRNNSNLHSGSYRLMNTISDVKLPPAQGEDVTVCSNSSDERASGLK